MSAQVNLFQLQDLDDRGKTRNLADRDLGAMRAVADWIGIFVTRPHPGLGRAGPVCPFVPRALEYGTLWLAAETSAGRNPADVAPLVCNYRDLLCSAQPREGEAAAYKAIVVVFSDLPVDHAGDWFANAQLQELKRSSYAEQGVVIGEFYDGNNGSAIRNPDFKPFRAPAPFLLMRRAVISDWMFFLDNDDWFNLWARRFGESAVATIAERLRRTNWRHVES